MVNRIFDKYYNRSTPLMTLQYWQQGEYKGLKELTRGLSYYKPLFIYQKGNGVDVYYANVDECKIPLKYYFKKNPKKFKSVAEKYEKQCRQMLALASCATLKDFQKIYNLHVSFWAKLAIMISVAGLIEKKDKSKIVRQAYVLRKKTEKVEYISGNNLIRLAKQIKPEFRNDIDYLTIQEILSTDNPNLRDLNKRKDKYIYYDNKIYPGLSVEAFEKMLSCKVMQATNHKNLIPPHFIVGSVAAKGKVRGKAKIIMELDDLKKIKKGDILVTPMTTPDYLWAMHKAAAFVTDEGGITCHAAIVAREFKKPCIIGTKIATQILKDGDKIEVDADHGIVRKIK